MSNYIKTPNPFSIGDVVYVIGKTAPEMTTHKVKVFVARISRIKHRRFVAYGVTDNTTWYFSKKHFNRCVFKDREKARKAFKEYGYE